MKNFIQTLISAAKIVSVAQHNTVDFDDVPPSHLYSCIDAITSVGNSKGFAVLFDVD